MDFISVFSGLYHSMILLNLPVCNLGPQLCKNIYVLHIFADILHLCSLNGDDGVARTLWEKKTPNFEDKKEGDEN